MLSPEFFGHGFQLNGFLQHWVVAMPLDEIRSTHESTVFAGAPVVMPQIEKHKIDGVRERRTR